MDSSYELERIRFAAYTPDALGDAADESFS